MSSSLVLSVQSVSACAETRHGSLVFEERNGAVPNGARTNVVGYAYALQKTHRPGHAWIWSRFRCRGGNRRAATVKTSHPTARSYASVSVPGAWFAFVLERQGTATRGNQRGGEGAEPGANTAAALVELAWRTAEPVGWMR